MIALSNVSRQHRIKPLVVFLCLFSCLLLTWGCSGSGDASDPSSTDQNQTDNTSGTDTTSDTSTDNGDSSDSGSDTSDTSSGTDTTTSASLIQPADLVYKGAFRLPDGTADCDWTYSGHAMTFYPDGDPNGADDGYPGSLFAVGNDAECQYVSEISIPVPVISATKSLDDLNTATTLQSFKDIRGGMFGEHQNLSLPRVGLAYLPKQGSQTSDKLYFCWAQHIQSFEASHGWCELDLSNPQTAGPWFIGGYTNYVTNDYIFDIPKEWADINLPDHYLATGRAREGPWSGYGPALFAFAPWLEGNPPTANQTLTSVTPLLLYGTQEAGTPEIVSDATMAMDDYQDSDHWYGGSWLTSSTKSALVFAGTKATGSSWYGFANGVVWDYDCAEHDPPTCPDYPAWPYDDRGFWAEGYSARMIFFNPDDIAAVAAGTKNAWEPQPYATMTFDDVLFDGEIHPETYRRDLVGAMSFDRTHGLIYIFEKQADDQKCIVHVWQINDSSS